MSISVQNCPNEETSGGPDGGLRVVIRDDAETDRMRLRRLSRKAGFAFDASEEAMRALLARIARTCAAVIAAVTAATLEQLRELLGAASAAEGLASSLRKLQHIGSTMSGYLAGVDVGPSHVAGPSPRFVEEFCK